MIERSCLGELVTFVAAQLGLAQALLVDYAGRDQTITNHARELAARLGMRGPVRSDIRIEIIREQWGEVLRLVVSIKAGHVAPSVMLRKIAAYERQNQLDVALQEIGKIERALFMLDWLENPKLRRHCHAGLNNSEQRHVLTQAIYTFRQGRIIDRSHEAQQYWGIWVGFGDRRHHLLEHDLYGQGGQAPPQRRRRGGAWTFGTFLTGEHITFSGDFLWERPAAATDRKALILPGRDMTA